MTAATLAGTFTPKAKLLAGVVKPSSRRSSRAGSTFQTIQEEIESIVQLRESLNNLSSMEAPLAMRAKSSLLARSKEAQAALSKLVSKCGGAARVLVHSFKELTMNSLRERDESGMPLLMPIELAEKSSSSAIRLLVRPGRHSSSRDFSVGLHGSLFTDIPNLLSNIRNSINSRAPGMRVSLEMSLVAPDFYQSAKLWPFYADLITGLMKSTGWETMLKEHKKTLFTLTPKLKGIILPKDRQKIEEAKLLASMLGKESQVLIMTDVQGISWEAKEIKLPKPKPKPTYDPVVIISAAGRHFHVYDFDTTPVEDGLLFDAK